MRVCSPTFSILCLRMMCVSDLALIYFNIWCSYMLKFISIFENACVCARKLVPLHRE